MESATDVGGKKMSENPFNFSNPVEGEDFYNRIKEIETAIGFIKKLQSFSVVGERRIGKTSFLNYIFSEELLKKYEINSEEYIIIHFNMGELYEKTKDVLIKTIVEEIKKQIQIEIDTENIFEKLNAYVARLASDGKKLVIALDEFEVIEPILDGNFSHWLRSIFEKPYVMAITSSQSTVGEIGPSGKASPLFNIFGNLFLGLFSRKETENMINEMFQKGGMKLEKEEISFPVDLSGGNPYLVQLIGYYYYEEKEKKRKIIPEEFMDSMLLYAKDQFEGYWNHLTEEERECLLNPDNMKDRICRILERKGYLKRENGKWKVFSELFGEFLCTKKKTKESISKGFIVRKYGKWSVSGIEILGAAVVVVILSYFLLKALEVIDPPDPSDYWNLILQSIVIIVTLGIFILRAYKGSIENLQIEINKIKDGINRSNRRIDLIEERNGRLDNEMDRLTQKITDIDKKLAILWDRQDRS